MVLVIVLSIVAPLCLVVIVLGCLNCFMKRKPSFSPFSNPGFVEEGTAGRHNDAFTVDMEATATPSNDNHAIEPIPDITPKPVLLPPLRPKILCVDKDSQNAGVSFFGSHRPFPRENLTYLNPLGVGWFGQVILTEALRISTGSMRSQVVVKILKDDASNVEEKQFIEEVLPFRHLDHPNVISLLGQCTEARPYLYIVEYAPHGNLKTFLQSHKQSMDTLLKKNKLLHFCLDAAAGVACIHRHNFIHCDLSSRNCLVTSDYTVKIGDYGIAEQLFKEDYFQSKDELLPVRWMAPECLVAKGNSWSSQNYSKASDMWSFGVLLWEVFSMAEQPYDMLTDEAVIQGVVLDRVVTLPEIPSRVPFHERLSAFMNECWKDPSERITIEPAHRILEEMSKEKVEKINDELDFDQKWNHLIPNTQSRSQSLASEDGSAIALAGSFSSETPFNLDDKHASVLSLDDIELNNEILKNDNVHAVQAVSNNQPLIQKDSLGLEQLNIKDEKVEVKSSLPSSATPSKKPTQQMTTSTPLANKSVQNETLTPPFPTALNAPNSGYNTAQEVITASSGVLESSSNSQNNSMQDFDFLSSERNKTVEKSVNDGVDTLNGTTDKVELMNADSNDVLSFGNTAQVEEIVTSKEETAVSLESFEINKKPEEEALSQSNDAFNFTDFSNNVNKNQDSGSLVSPEISKPQELDTSFDIIVPSVLNQDEKLATTPQPSSFKNAQFDFLEASVVAGFSQEQSNTINQIPQTVPTTKLKSAQDVTNDHLSFENDVLSSSNPFSSNNPFSPDDTASTYSQDAIFLNKSEVDVSSSVNSSMLGWDTSFPEGEATKHMEPTNDTAEIKQSGNSLSFLENTEFFEGPKGESSPISSDFSFLEEPVMSDSIIDSNQKVPAITSDTTPESFLTGFETFHQSPGPPLSLNQVDDVFGSVSPASQPTSFLSDSASEDATKTPTVPSVPATTSNSDAFDFMAFEFQSSVSNVTETQNPTDFDIFSTSLNDGAKENDQEKKTSSTSDFPGLDLFPGGVPADVGTAGLMQEGNLVFSSADNQVGTVYNCDSFPEHSEDESGVNCHSLTESPTIPTATSDSCYVSVTDSKSAEATSEEASKAYTISSDIHESNSIDPDKSDSTEVEESLNNIGNLEENSVVKSSPDDSEYINSSDETSSTSGSEREYICVNPFDTGQPPTFDPDHDKENLDPDSGDKDQSFDDLNEQDLKIVSEIYLSRGVKSPRVFEVPALETIPEHQTLHCVSEDAIPTPSETSSIGPRDDELFGSDSYEWDDFYDDDSLIGKDDMGPELDAAQSLTGEQNNISNWSLDFEADSQHSNASSVLSTTVLNRSDSACTGNDTKSLISDRCLSDSELVISKSSTAIPRQSLVASTLAKHRNRNRQFCSPLKSSRDKGNFYSLVEDFDFQLDSSQEDSSSPVTLSDDDEDIDVLDKKSHLHNSLISSSFLPSSSSISALLRPSSSSNSSISPKKSSQVLVIEQDMVKDVQASSTSSPSMDLLGLGFDSTSSGSNNVPVTEQGLDFTGKPQEVTNVVPTVGARMTSDVGSVLKL